jgi:NAD(P)-dependent dehydrogenase (short-subunit alcohol dehydrogenase family)
LVFVTARRLRRRWLRFAKVVTPLGGTTVNDWALVLGASSGFGAATCRACARAGMNVVGVHLDRKATLPDAEAVRDDVKKAGREALFFNVNAADDENRKQVLDEVAKRFQEGGPHRIKVLLHSLAFGTLKPYFGAEAKDALDRKSIEMTLDVMGHSLVYWVQDVHRRNLFARGSRVYAMTSAGGHKVWYSYGGVSAAKAALESHIRQISLELAKHGISANAIQAGVTDTPALRKIPGHEQMIENALKANPGGRLTTTEDVAKAIVALSNEDLSWMTGNVIRVDGGEDITG